MAWDKILISLLGIASDITSLVLIALGLAIIFGMMRVINFAHGEFMMLGAFFTLTFVGFGIPLWLAIPLAGVGTAVLGFAIEVSLVRRLYGKDEATILGTFGLSLVLTQVALLIWGTSPEGLATPLGHVRIGSYGVSSYRFLLIGFAILALIGVWLFFTRTRVGLMARASIEIPEMAAALGVNSKYIRTLTFSFGCALAGIGGGLLAPTVAITANMGSTIVAKAFVTVVVGGAGAVTGTGAAAVVLGTIERLVSDWAGSIAGVAAVLITAIIVIRILPTGISGKWRKTL